MTARLAGIKLTRTVRLALFVLFLFPHPHLYSQKNTIGEKRIEETTKEYVIQGVYPQYEIPKDALMGVRGMLMDFNSPIEQIVNSRADEFRKEVKEIRPSGETRKSTMDLTYTTVLGNNGTYSAKFETFTDVDFAAHPNAFYDSYNFNFDSWSPFTLKDIFLESSNYLKVISDYCYNDLMKTFKDDYYKGMEDEIKKGTAPLEENFKTFNVDENNLIITFQYYQVGPRIWGAPEVKIPYYKIKKIINPAGPLAGYYKK